MENKGKVLDGFLIVEKYDKIKKRNDSPFQQAVSNNNLGTVLESADEDFQPGNLVYFMNKYERVVMGGAEVYVMKRDNIFKVIPGAENAETKE